MLGRWAGVGEQRLVFDAAEIRTFEQLGRKNDLGPLRVRLPHQLGDVPDVRDGVVAKGKLERGDCDLGHLAPCSRGSPCRATLSSQMPISRRAMGWVTG